MAVQYYSWEDDGAPQFEKTRNVSGNYQNSIIDIMDAILINGYGTKPGMGWTKEFTSTVTDSNRTVYKNKSAHADDMFFIIESMKNIESGFKAQIADAVISPEVYSGYSQVAGLYQIHTGTQRWHAIGDERTFVFVFYSYYADQTSVSNWSSYSPMAFYVGDFDIPNNSNPKGWGLLAHSMKEGTLDSLGESYSGDNRGTFNLMNTQQPYSKTDRPVTQIPGELWSEADAYCFTASFESRPPVKSSNPPSRDISEFEQNAQLRSEWFFILNFTNIYRLRGVYNIYPWLSHSNMTNNRNWAKIVHVFGDDYMPLMTMPSNTYYRPMTVYIKATGDW